METTFLCARIRAWMERYPDPAATPEQNARSRALEDERLAPFAGLTTLDRDLASRCGVSLRHVDRALWVAAAHPEVLSD